MGVLQEQKLWAADLEPLGFYYDQDRKMWITGRSYKLADDLYWVVELAVDDQGNGNIQGWVQGAASPCAKRELQDVNARDLAIMLDMISLQSTTISGLSTYYQDKFTEIEGHFRQLEGRLRVLESQANAYWCILDDLRAQQH